MLEPANIENFSMIDNLNLNYFITKIVAKQFSVD